MPERKPQYTPEILAVECPTCNVGKGKRCRRADQITELPNPHTKRVNRMNYLTAILQVKQELQNDPEPPSDPAPIPTPRDMPQRRPESLTGGETAASRGPHRPVLDRVSATIAADRMRAVIDQAQIDYIRKTLYKLRVEKRRVFGRDYYREHVAARMGVPVDYLTALEEGRLPVNRIYLTLLQSYARAIGARVVMTVILDDEHHDALNVRYCDVNEQEEV